MRSPLSWLALLLAVEGLISSNRVNYRSSQLYRDLTGLESWAVDVGIYKNVAWKCQDNLWGVYAANNIEKGDLLLRVPNSMILASSRIEKDLNERYNLTAAVQRIEHSAYRLQLSQFYLLLQLLLEIKDDTSSFQPWIDSLPQEIRTSVTMTDDEVEKALPPFAYSLATAERQHYQVFHKALQQLDFDFDADTVQWAFQVVFTRSWRYDPKEELGNERCDIVPTGDLFNHGTMNVQLDYDAYDNLCAYAAEDIAEGEQLCISYGRPTNPYRFLCIFGFVDTSMPSVFSQITVQDPSKEHVKLGYDLDKMTFDTADGSVSDAVWRVLSYTILLSQRPDQAARLYEAHVSDDTKTVNSILEEYRLETSLTLYKHVQRTLEEFAGLEYPENGNMVESIRQCNDLVFNTFVKVQERLKVGIMKEMKKRKSTVSQ